MQKTVRAWLNGTRDYSMGVKLYALLSDNESLKKQFAAGENAWNKWKLGEELITIYNQLNRPKKICSAKCNKTCSKRIVVSSVQKKSEKTENPLPKPTTDLYKICKEKADVAYKENMNERALLFSMVPASQYELVNRADLVNARKDLCLKVLRDNITVSELYDAADYVKEHGTLPESKSDAKKSAIKKRVPDHLLKHSIDNLKKNINKIEGREQTPERVKLLQDHKKELVKLEKRWHSLKQKK